MQTAKNSSSDQHKTGLAWIDSFQVGDITMDKTHQEFVELANQLLHCSPESAGQALAEIEAHTLAHFGHEKHLMETTDFPAAECHLDEHQKVLDSIQEVHRRQQSNTISIVDIKRLALALIDWFPGHLTYMDSALSTWLSKKKHNAAPVVFHRHIGAD